MSFYLYRSSFLSLLFVPFILDGAVDEFFFDYSRSQRRFDSHTVKAQVCEFDDAKPLPQQRKNGDEDRYGDFRASFGKSLEHTSQGYVVPQAFSALVKALETGSVDDFNQIPMGQGIRKLVSPQASLCFSLSGNDGWINAIPPAPQFASAEAAGEMVELYWTALVRDIPFNQYPTNSTVAQAIADLNSLSDFKGPKQGGVVTPGTFLRGSTPGDLAGPYISQFLYQIIPFGNTTIGPEQEVPNPGVVNDFLTNFPDWFNVATGGVSGQSIDFDPAKHFIRNPRDLTEYVHRDSPGQAAFAALLLLCSYGKDALDSNNPYLNSETQDGFVTFGVAGAMELLRSAIQEGLKAAWYHKWQVNRRLRPEEFGSFVQKQIEDGMPQGIDQDLIQSDAIQQIYLTYGSYFLPVAYPEGSPTHPSYPAGHATLMGAAVTVLKAVFNESFLIPNPLQPNTMNTALESYPGVLTVGGELNKLAANIALGRDHAGVHYRSDGIYGLLLGEQVAIDVLNNGGFLLNEDFPGYTLTKFDGSVVRVGQSRHNR